MVMWLYDSESLILGHQSSAPGAFKSEIKNFNLLLDLKRLHVQKVRGLHGWKLLLVIHHLASFYGPMSCGSRYVTYLNCACPCKTTWSRDLRLYLRRLLIVWNHTAMFDSHSCCGCGGMSLTDHMDSCDHIFKKLCDCVSFL